MRTPIHLFKCKSPKLAKAVKKIAKELRQVHGRKQGLLMHVYSTYRDWETGNDNRLL